MTPPRIVDTHLHLWDLDQFEYPWLADDGAEDLHWDYLVDDWVNDSAAVDVAATVHVQAEMSHATDPAEETAWLASLEAHRPSDPVPTVCIGYADLRAPDLDDVLDRHQRHSLFRGVRQEAWFDPNSARADVPRHNLLDDAAWVAGLDRLSSRQLSFDLLVWSHQLTQAASIFAEKPELAVVLEHTGLPIDSDAEQRELWRSGMRSFATKVPHAMLKISALRFVSATWSLPDLAPVVKEAIEIFGPHRCMFGSNFPVDRPAISYHQLWSGYDSMTADLSNDERTMMFTANAARTYRIDLPEAS